jgi:hypothetical protein
LIQSIAISRKVVSQADTVTAAVTIGIATNCIRTTRKERQKRKRRGERKKEGTPPEDPGDDSQSSLTNSVKVEIVIMQTVLDRIEPGSSLYRP